MDDTIAAICTALGAAGLAVLRVSGSRALVIADDVFRGARPLVDAASHTLHHGWAHVPAEHAAGREVVLDEVVAAVFRGPRSYTGEDVVELSCHGGRLSATRVLGALIAAGARLARPGEFTLRAFLNGRMDLARAEAVADVIHAESETAHALALGQLAGALSRELESLADRITTALSEVEARVDFAEDVGGVEVPVHVVAALDSVHASLGALLSSAAWGRALREGVRVPIVGRPNVGKSSLFNALVGEARAIVTAHPGTTRDRVSATLELGGAVVTLSDTAGLRETSDVIEAIGVRLAREALEAGRMVVWVVDGSAMITDADRDVAGALAGKRVVVALNKRDLGSAVARLDIETLLGDAGSVHVVEVSVVNFDGVDTLREAMAAALELSSDATGTERGATPIALSNARHVEALGRASEALRRASVAAAVREPGECVALELRECLGAMGEVTGRDVSADVLDRIFATFCIGK